MITAIESTNGTGVIIVSSDKKPYPAKIWDYRDNWQLQYHNSQRKHFKEYIDIIEYLKSKGW